MAALDGRNFIPMGGVHDGGADGALEKEMYQTESANIFYQMTTQSDYKAKIKQTGKRLREFSRNPRVRYYVTSKTIPQPDREGDSLTEELGVIIKIRDAKDMCFHINDKKATK